MAEDAVEERRHSYGASDVGAYAECGARCALDATLASRGPAHYVVGVVRVVGTAVDGVGALPPGELQKLVGGNMIAEIKLPGKKAPEKSPVENRLLFARLLLNKL